MIDAGQMSDRFCAEQAERANALATKILSGKCTSFEDYRASTAELKGIDASTKRFKDLLNKLLGEE